jgi:hypothetical protein
MDGLPPDPLNLAANAGSSWTNFKPSTVRAMGARVEPFFLKQREYKTALQWPFAFCSVRQQFFRFFEHKL